MFLNENRSMSLLGAVSEMSVPRNNLIVFLVPKRLWKSYLGQTLPKKKKSSWAKDTVPWWKVTEVCVWGEITNPDIQAYLSLCFWDSFPLKKNQMVEADPDPTPKTKNCKTWVHSALWKENNLQRSIEHSPASGAVSHGQITYLSF